MKRRALLLIALLSASAFTATSLTRGDLTVSLEDTRRDWRGAPQAGRLTFQRGMAEPVTSETSGLAGAGFSGFSPDGRWLAVLNGIGGYVQLWDTRTGQRKFTLLAHDHLSNDARIAEFSPDSRRVVFYAYPNELSLWDTSTGQRVRLLSLSAPLWHLGDVDVHFSPDGKVFLVTGGGAPARLFETERGVLKQVFDQPRDGYDHLRGYLAGVFSHDGKHLAVLYGGGEARLYNRSNQKAQYSGLWASDLHTLDNRVWSGKLTLAEKRLSGMALGGWTFAVKF